MGRLEERDAKVLFWDEFEFFVKEMQVKKKGEILTLSKTELQLLLYLLENAGQIVTKERLRELGIYFTGKDRDR